MQDDKDAQARNELSSEIEILEEIYTSLQKCLSNNECDSLEIVSTLKVFKDSLDRISAHILTFYTLRGQRTKITWEQLLTNISTALEALRSTRNTNPKIAIQTALSMSEPKAEEVMNYLSSLKKLLQ